MAYAQIKYNQRLGTGSDTIHWAGCFLTAFCNLMERFGVKVDPPTLNMALINKKGFIGSNMAGWSALTKVYSNIVVTKTGYGWPTTNNVIVEFRYVHNGQNMTHFCLMADWTKKTIVDSWDGVVRNSGYYGTPVAYAVYKKVNIVQKAIAAVKPKPTPAPVAPPKVQPKPAPQAFYTVVSGDNLSKIAARYKLSLANLEHLNPQIKNFNLVFPGQKIRVK